MACGRRPLSRGGLYALKKHKSEPASVARWVQRSLLCVVQGEALKLGRHQGT